ncbi:BnaC05g32830D [Brassica napus]|uniref:BnaC05g32830D protein n=1 Tax=Brassica napus TaxID=3708 RepID=A0A078GH38_BRANA|nr:BnaC05g32830D [Brassica napus]
MIPQSSPSSSFDFLSHASVSRRLLCPCSNEHGLILFRDRFARRRILRRKTRVQVTNASSRFVSGGDSARKVARSLVLARFSNEFEDEQESPSSQESSIQSDRNSFTNYREDPIVDKLRTQLGVIHPIPSPPINRNAIGLFVFFFFVGVVCDKLWAWRKRRRQDRQQRAGPWAQLPSPSFEKDLQRKESVEWVNMVLVKLWKVYRGGIENWLVGLLQPVIDDLKKPDYVKRVEIKQFSLGDEPLSVRNVERRTSRRVNDLQYQIGLRYTGGARMLLMLTLKFGIIPVVVPVGIRDFDIDGELWVKLRLIPSAPWVGAASWAFVSLPKIKFELAPFRLFNLMGIPVLSMFLTKLLTEDLPRLFVRPKKIVLDFQKGKAVGPVSEDIKPGDMQEGNKDFVGELSVTLVNAQKLPYMFSGKLTDPYVILRMGDQVIRSKKNSQTTVIGAPGQPIWNQDFQFLVSNPREQVLQIEVNDCLGFADMAIGTGEVDLGSLPDTVPTDRIVVLQGGWSLFGKGSAGEILLRLTYKAYVEDEEDDKRNAKAINADASDDDMSDSEEPSSFVRDKIPSDDLGPESFMNVLSALILSEEFQGIVSSEAGNKLYEGEASVPPVPSKASEDSKSQPDDSGNGGISDLEVKTPSSDRSSVDDGGLALLWFSVITSVLVLVAINMGGSSFFNP